MKRIIVSVVAAIVIAGCVQTHVSMLDDRTASISGLGGTVASMDEVHQKVIVTAAQEAKARGYQYFVILGAQDATRTGIVYSPATESSAGFASPYTQPGQNVTVRFFHEGEVDPKLPNIWDVSRILAAQPKE